MNSNKPKNNYSMHYKLMMKTLSQWLTALLLTGLFASSCLQSNVFEKNVALPGNRWKSDLKPAFSFHISDTSAHYLLYVTLRHTDAYHFSNIWLQVSTRMPGDTQTKPERVEIPLAQADGKWMGRGMNEIWQHQMSLSGVQGYHRFPRKGIYTIQLEQIMRVDPLPEIMSVGIRIEKAPK